MLLKGKPVADKISEEIKTAISNCSSVGNRCPKVALLRVGENPDDIAYESGVIKNCRSVGISSEVTIMNENVSTDEFVKILGGLNRDPDVNGILIFQPLPSGLDLSVISETIAAEKDIDGMNPINMAKLFSGDKSAMAPCTAEAVVEILKHYFGDISGKNVVIINRSLVLGKPLSMLLLAENATVTVCHSKTKKMADITSKADIVVTGIGKGEFFGPEYFSSDSIVVDVGINFIDGKMCGDVDFEKVSPMVKAITPVPGGLGTVTSMVLLRNVIKGTTDL